MNINLNYLFNDKVDCMYYKIRMLGIGGKGGQGAIKLMIFHLTAIMLNFRNRGWGVF